MEYFIVKKLNDADSPLVNSIIQKISRISKAVNWKEVSVANEANLVIAIGGDGTLLHGMRISEEFGIPVVGVNIGKLGFLAEIQPSDIEEAIIDFVNQQFTLDSRTILREKDTGAKAVNEFLIAPTLAQDTLKYEFFVDGKSSGIHHANGLIISTPTGSTAYSLSVGGSILQPNAGVFQITPVAPMSLNSRSVVVSDSSRISVKIRTIAGKKYSLIADGRLAFEFDGINDSGGDDYSPAYHSDYTTINFGRNPQVATLMHTTKWNFFEVLQKKLHWNTEV